MLLLNPLLNHMLLNINHFLNNKLLNLVELLEIHQQVEVTPFYLNYKIIYIIYRNYQKLSKIIKNY